MKVCPYCCSDIDDRARKCKYCWERVDDKNIVKTENIKEEKSSQKNIKDEIKESIDKCEEKVPGTSKVKKTIKKEGQTTIEMNNHYGDIFDSIENKNVKTLEIKFNWMKFNYNMLNYIVDINCENLYLLDFSEISMWTSNLKELFSYDLKSIHLEWVISDKQERLIKEYNWITYVRKYCNSSISLKFWALILDFLLSMTIVWWILSISMFFLDKKTLWQYLAWIKYFQKWENNINLWGLVLRILSYSPLYFILCFLLTYTNFYWILSTIIWIFSFVIFCFNVYESFTIEQSIIEKKMWIQLLKYSKQIAHWWHIIVLFWAYVVSNVNKR